MDAVEAVCRILDAAGVETVFTLQSDGNMRLLAHLHGEREDVRLITARHEQAAVAMADGYARASGDLAVCTVGRGPAVAQTGTALVTARRRGSDLLLLVPATPVESTYDIKEFRQEAFLETTLGNVRTVRHRDTLIDGVREGLRRIRAGDGPVAVQVDRSVLEGSVEVPGEDPFAPLRTGGSGARASPDGDRIARAADLYADSDPAAAPVVLAGRGAVRSGAREAIEALAERLNALLVTTVEARGYFDDHPFAPGFVGHYGKRLANEYARESDFVLAVGCSLNPHTADKGDLFDHGQTLVQIDADPAAIGRYTPVDLGIVGDAAAGVEAIREELAGRGVDRTGAFWTDAVRERIAAAPPFDPEEAPDSPGTVDPRDLVRALDRLLPADRTVVTDTGHHTRWVLDALGTPAPEEFIWPGEFASIGLGLPTGIGAALADPGRTCVTVCGDAGFTMAQHGVETAARHGVPLVVAVMNDRALGTEYHSLLGENDHADVSVIGTPDLAEVATAMGARGETVRSVRDIDALAGLLGDTPEGPVVLDCRVNRGVAHRSKR